jgi:large subunit ribosomal protein L17
MRHRISGRRLSRTTAHSIAMRRNLAQSLIQYGQVETTVPKAKEVRRFIEKVITLARQGDLQARQRVISLLGDRAMIPTEQQSNYEQMGYARREKVLRTRSGRRHRTGMVPASYNKKKVPFVASSVVHKLMTDVAPRYQDRPGGYTRIIRLSKRRIGDATELCILQLVGTEEPGDRTARKTVGRRRKRTELRRRRLKDSERGATQKSAKSSAPAKTKDVEQAAAEQADET